MRMLRYVMGIRWQDGFSNEEVVRSGLEDLEVLLRKNRLICEQAWKKGEVPEDWKKAIIVPLYKG